MLLSQPPSHLINWSGFRRTQREGSIHHGEDTTVLRALDWLAALEVEVEFYLIHRRKNGSGGKGSFEVFALVF